MDLFHLKLWNHPDVKIQLQKPFLNVWKPHYYVIVLIKYNEVWN